MSDQLAITYVSVLDLHGAEYNPRQIADVNLQLLTESLSRFGVVDPIIARRDGLVIGGHQRLAAALALGLAEVPVVYLDVDDATAKAMNVALNNPYMQGTWDDGKLAVLLEELRSEDKLDWTGFEDADLEKLLAQLRQASDGNTGADDIPEDVEPVTKSGDLWILGDHRLLCGDACNPADVARVLDGAAPLLMVTDPPYGVEYKPEWRTEAAARGQLSYAASRIGPVTNDDRADWSEAWLLFPGDVAYTWSGGADALITTGAALLSAGYQVRAQIIWRKSNFPIGRGHYTRQHEPCWYAVKKGRQAHWIGDHNASTVWDITLDKNVEGGHSTQKPVECMERPIRNHLGDVYDPFLGSGTTLIAAERQGRKGYFMEIEPKYVDVAVRRFELYSGKKAELA